jgi:kumamolisin
VTGLSPSDIDRAYDFRPLHQFGLDGYSQTIALAEIGTFNPSDIATYDQQYNIIAPPVRVVPIGPGASAATPEPTLDIELVHALAPHAHIVVYESPDDLLSVAEMVSQIVSDDQAQVLSISLGTCEAELDPSIATTFLTSLSDSFSLASVEGISILVASGDSGAYDCQDSQLSVNAVAASPYVTSVGGTTLFLHTDGTYNYEAGWEGPLEEVGGGGGLSTLYQRPAWQLGPGVDNAYSDGMRQVPDVSADADPLSGYAVYYSGKGCRTPAACWQIVGGTSAATPLWAALILLIDQLAEQHGQHRLGFLNPALYQLGAGSGRGVTAPLPFHDVGIGGNLYFDATSGWDYSTGWGSPDAAVLAQDILHVQLS